MRPYRDTGACTGCSLRALQFCFGATRPRMIHTVGSMSLKAKSPIMKSLLFFINSALIVQLSQCYVAPFSDLARIFSLQAQDDLIPLLSGNLSSYTVEFGPHGALVKRQCADSGYVPCADQPGCCPAGDTCFPNGCCPAGQQACGSNHCYDPSTSKCCLEGLGCPLDYDCVEGGCCPSGEQRCGSSKCYNPKTNICCQSGGNIWGCPTSDKCCSDNYCYNPNSEQCCQNGSCQKGDTCCGKECCKSIAYCAADGYCSQCPAATKTITTTSDSTYSSITTRTITEVSEPEEATGFSCPPMTVTNSEGATLELDTECALSYTPPETSESSARITARNAPITPVPQLRPRQLSCTPFETITSTLTSTRSVTSRFTETTTVFTEQVDFSCVPMSVTNAFGDELSLDEKCQLEFSPAEPTSSSTSSGATRSSAPQASQQSAASRRESFIVSVWGVVVVAFLGLLA